MVAPSHVPPDRNIEGLIGEDHARDIHPHEPFDEGRIGSVSADQAMGAEQEQIAYLSDCRGAGQRREIASFASMIAAENTGRVCCGVELDPLYVDVIIRRYQAETGAAVILADTGATFEEVAARRRNDEGGGRNPIG